MGLLGFVESQRAGDGQPAAVVYQKAARIKRTRRRASQRPPFFAGQIGAGKFEKLHRIGFVGIDGGELSLPRAVVSSSISSSTSSSGCAARGAS
jgi:hypothetical protein